MNNNNDLDPLFDLETNSPRHLPTNNHNTNYHQHQSSASSQQQQENNTNNNNQMMMMMMPQANLDSNNHQKQQNHHNNENDNEDGSEGQSSTIHNQNQNQEFDELLKLVRKDERNERRDILADSESEFTGILVEIAKIMTRFFETSFGNQQNLLSSALCSKLAPFQQEGVHFMFRHLVACRLLANNNAVVSPTPKNEDNNNNEKDEEKDKEKKIELKSSGGCLLGDEMGCGKTVQVASFLGAWVRARENVLDKEHEEQEKERNNNKQNYNQLMMMLDDDDQDEKVPSSCDAASPFDSIEKKKSVLFPNNNNDDNNNNNNKNNNNNNNNNTPFRALIVCPSTLVSIWVDALQQWAGVPSNCIEVVTKAKSQRLQQWKQSSKYLNKKFKQQQQNPLKTSRSKSPTPATVTTANSTSTTMMMMSAPSLPAAAPASFNNHHQSSSSISPAPGITQQQQQNGEMLHENNNNNNNNNKTIDDDDLLPPPLPIFTDKVLPQNSCLFFVCTYGVMKNDVEDILDDLPPFDCCVLDEAQMIKDPSTDVFKAASTLKSMFRIAVTGTPLSNHFGDIWSVMQFVDPSVIPLTRAQFAKVNAVLMKGNERNISEDEEENARTALADLRGRLERFILRREKKDVAEECMALGLAKNSSDAQHENDNEDDDGSNNNNNNQMMMMMMPPSQNTKQQQKQQQKFPEKIDAVIWCRLTPEQEDVYRRFLECDEVTEALRPGSSKSPFVLLTCLLKICNHPWLNFPAENFKQALTSPFETVEGRPESGGALSSSKVQALLAIARQAKQDDQKLLVFSKSKKFHDIIASVFSKTDIDFCRLDGKVPAAERANLVRKINAFPRSLVCLATTQVGGVGLTFNGISRVVLADPSWNPAIDAQAVDRVHRVGQMAKTVTVIRLITCGTVEEKVYRNQLHKMIAAFQALGTDPQQLLRYFTHTQLRDMFTLSKTDRSETNRALKDVHVMLYRSGLVKNTDNEEQQNNNMNSNDNDDDEKRNNQQNLIPPYPGHRVREVFEKLKSLTNSVVDVSDHGSVLKVSSTARKNLEEMLNATKTKKNEQNKNNGDSQARNGDQPQDDEEENGIVAVAPFARKKKAEATSSQQQQNAAAPQRRQRNAKESTKSENNVKRKENSASSSQQQDQNSSNNNNDEDDDEDEITDMSMLLKNRQETLSQNSNKDEKTTSSQQETKQRERHVTITSPTFSQQQKEDQDYNDDDDDDDESNIIKKKKRFSAELQQHRKSDHAFRHSMAETMWKLCSSQQQQQRISSASSKHDDGEEKAKTSKKLSPIVSFTATTNQNNSDENDDSNSNQQQQNQIPVLSQPVKMVCSSNNNNNTSTSFHDFTLDSSNENNDEDSSAVRHSFQKRKSERHWDADEEHSNRVRDENQDSSEFMYDTTNEGDFSVIEKPRSSRDDENNNNNNNEYSDDDDDDEEEGRESELLELFMLDPISSSSNSENNGPGRFTRTMNDSRQSFGVQNQNNNNNLNHLRLDFRSSALRGTLEARDSDFALFNEDNEE